MIIYQLLRVTLPQDHQITSATLGFSQESWNQDHQSQVIYQKSSVESHQPRIINWKSFWQIYLNFQSSSVSRKFGFFQYFLLKVLTFLGRNEYDNKVLENYGGKEY